ncbi:hypothetical protein [Rhizobium laguerreae]|uniref:hypothetical protein n=1 Tax=Rhizobium laguerreae TaxID=1076926 RepID=UPI002484B688|nr:hypothetical protein [Rhizobium laguerreae]
MPSKSSLVIFLHGIGASGAQLMPLAASWRSSLPNTRFAAPDAPYHIAMATSGLSRREIRSIRPASERLAKHSTD